MNPPPRKAYLGVDIGSISTKGVVLDRHHTLLAHSYLWTEGDPIRAVRRVLEEIERQLDGRGARVVAVGTTGSARELIGTILSATVVKNEITAHAIGTLTYHPDVRTIFEIGGQDSKLIIIHEGIVVDYAMNTLCAAGTGSFLTSQARRLNIPVEEFGTYALKSTRPTKIAGRCTVFAESDLVHKAQMGHPREDIIAGLCESIVRNYLNNVGKGKNLEPPFVFQGGVSKNVGVVKAFERIIGAPVAVDELGHLMGAIGVALLAREQGEERPFDFAVKEVNFRTVGIECGGCPNNCEVICVLREDTFLDGWGNRCPVGLERAKQKIAGTRRAPAEISAPPTVHAVRLMEKRFIAEETMCFAFHKPENFAYRPGQYLFLTLPELAERGTQESTRAMSVASAPHEDCIMVAMRLSPSLFKRTIRRLPAGATVEIEGPHGELLLHDDDRPAVFVAGGIGIAPFRGMLVEERARGWPRGITLFYSGRRREDLAFLEDFRAMRHPRFRCVPTVTRSDESDQSWAGERGRISPAVIEKYVDDLSAPVYYVVGAPRMVSGMTRTLTDMGVRPGQIKTELFTGYEEAAVAMTPTREGARIHRS